MQRSNTGQVAYTVYPASNYSFGTKGPKVEKDSSIADKLKRMKQKYEREGMRRSVEGVLIVQEHNHPHILLLQAGANYFRLPGGRLRPGEDEMEGLRRKLVERLSPTDPQLMSPWDIGECVGTFWRPNYDAHLYPYVPPHITKPKECRKMFVVHLPERCYFAVPKNLRLLAVPLFELYDNMGRYGPSVSALPALLSRLRLTIVRATLPLPPPPQQQTVIIKHEEEFEESKMNGSY